MTRALPPSACCPVCHATVEPLESAYGCGGCGRRFASLDGVPVLIADADLTAVDLRAAALPPPVFNSADMGIPAISDAMARGDHMLELGAGLDINDAALLVTTDAFVYDAGRLDVVADAHALPFADASFDFVFSLAVFEHLHSPWLAVEEIARVLRKGGRVYTLAAFLQPLHGFPDHYFNATESGLRRLFCDRFEIELAGPSRHCPHRQSLVPGDRMREMAQDLLGDRSVHWRARVRAWRLARAVTRAGYEFLQLADQMADRPAGHAAWRQIAPAVEVLAVRR
jgi:SAM-dependent methyltransferase